MLFVNYVAEKEQTDWPGFKALALVKFKCFVMYLKAVLLDFLFFQRKVNLFRIFFSSIPIFNSLCVDFEV